VQSELNNVRGRDGLTWNDAGAAVRAVDAIADRIAHEIGYDKLARAAPAELKQLQWEFRSAYETRLENEEQNNRQLALIATQPVAPKSPDQASAEAMH
jgi:hypothetical protein